MSELAKATLQVLKDTPGGTRGEQSNTVTRDDSKKLVVQLNPTSLRLERRNNIDRGAVTTGTQRRQNISSEGATLTFDLEFDTADELDPDLADVRLRTQKVRDFVEPPEGGKRAPPRVEFHWGTLTFRGIMTQVTEELDYFSPEGRPLRAKLSVSITEQDLKFEKGETGPGAGDATRSAPPGAGPGTGPGGSGTRDVTKEVRAQEGESAQQLAARLGGDPNAWRSLMNGLDSPLGIPAGTPVQVGPRLDAAPGIGVSDGFGGGLPPTSLVALAGALDVSANISSGFVLSSAGGVSAAALTVRSDTAARAVVDERGSFDVPVRPVRITAGQAADPRAFTYAAAVPLSARGEVPIQVKVEVTGGRSIAARARRSDVPAARDQSSPPWERLPARSAGRSRGDAEQRRRDASRSTIT